jgi:hypothetical protein
LNVIEMTLRVGEYSSRVGPYCVKFLDELY